MSLPTDYILDPAASGVPEGYIPDTSAESSGVPAGYTPDSPSMAPTFAIPTAAGATANLTADQYRQYLTDIRAGKGPGQTTPIDTNYQDQSVARRAAGGLVQAYGGIAPAFLRGLGELAGDQDLTNAMNEAATNTAQYAKQTEPGVVSGVAKMVAGAPMSMTPAGAVAAGVNTLAEGTEQQREDNTPLDLHTLAKALANGGVDAAANYMFAKGLTGEAAKPMIMQLVNRFGMNETAAAALSRLVIGGTAMASQQTAHNAIEGHPLLAGVPTAAATGGLMEAGFGQVHDLGNPTQTAEEVAPKPTPEQHAQISDAMDSLLKTYRDTYHLPEPAPGKEVSTPVETTSTTETPATVNEKLAAPQQFSAEDMWDYIKTKNTGEVDKGATLSLLGDKQYEQRDVPIQDVGDSRGEATPDKVNRYANKPADTSPPIVIGDDGRPIDGKNRLAAAIQRGDTTIKAYVPADSDLGNAYDQGVKSMQDRAGEAQAQKAVDRATIPQDRTTKQIVRENTGQTDPSRLISEAQALRASIKSQARGAREGYSAAKSDTTAMRKQLVETIQDTLPPQLRGKLLNQVAGADTPAKLADALDMAEQTAKDHQGNLAITAAEKVTGPLGVKTSRAFEGTEAEVAEKTGQQKVAALNRDEPIKQVDVPTLAEPYRSQVQQHLKEAKQAASDVKFAENDNDRADAMQRLQDVTTKINTARLANEHDTSIYVSGVRKNRTNVITDSINRIGTQKADTPEQATGKAPHDWNIPTRLIHTHENVPTLLENTFRKDSDLYKAGVNDIADALDKEHGEKYNWLDRRDPALTAAGYKPGTEKFDDLVNTPESVILSGDKTVSLTRSQQIGLVAMSRDPDAADMLAEGMPLTSRDNPRATPIKFNADDIKAISDKLSPAELKIADAWNQHTADLGPRVQDAKLKISGSAPDLHNGYYPLARNLEQNPEVNVPEGWRPKVNRAVENIDSMKARSGGKTPLFIPDIIRDTDAHVADAATLIHTAEPIRNLASVVGNPRFKRAVETQLGNHVNTRMTQFLDDLVGQPRSDLNVIQRGAAALNRNVYRAVLSLPSTSWFKHAIGGMTRAIPDFDLRDYATGLRRTLDPRTTGDVFKEMITHVPSARAIYDHDFVGHYSPLTEVNRIGQMTLSEAVKAIPGRIAGGDVSGTLRAGSDVLNGSRGMQAVDSYARRLVWAASVAEAQRTMPNASPKDQFAAARVKFLEASRNSQTGTNPLEVSGLYSNVRKEPISASFFDFSGPGNKAFNMLARLKNADGPTRLKILGSLGVSAAIMGAGNAGAKYAELKASHAISGTPITDKEYDQVKAAGGTGALSTLASPVYFGRDLYDLSKAIVSGKTNEHIFSNPVESAFEDVYRGLTGVSAAIHKSGTETTWAKQAETAHELRTGLLNATSGTQTLLGLPTARAEDTISEMLNSSKPDRRTK